MASFATARTLFGCHRPRRGGSGPVADPQHVRGMPELDFYPAQLTQISTKGNLHNHAPIRVAEYIPDLDAPDDGGFPARFSGFTSMA